MGALAGNGRRAAGVLAGLVAGLAALGAGPAQARWLKAETARFVVYSDGDEAGLRAYAQKLEVFDDMLRVRHGLSGSGEPAPRKLSVYLVRGDDELKRVWPGAGFGTGGFYAASAQDVYALAMRGERQRQNVTGKRQEQGEAVGYLTPDQVVFHEYVHHFMARYFAYGYPSWLFEGYAEYFMMTDVAADHVDVGLPNNGRGIWIGADAAWKKPSMRDLLGKSLDKIDEDDRIAFYARAWALTHYLMSEPTRQTQLMAYMKAVGAGADPVKAMEAATGLSPEALEEKVRAYVKGGLNYRRYKRTAAADAAVTVSELPPSADDLLLESVALGEPRLLKDEDRARLLKTVRARAAAWPGDRLAELTLARVEILAGDRKAGEALLERRLAAEPNDVEALELAGSARLDDGDADKARTRDLYAQAAPLIAKAFQLDPDRYQTLLAYARMRRVLDAPYPSDNTLEALLAALEFAPQVSTVRLDAADGMMRRGRGRDAAAILAPLANDPHGGEDAARAREMLKQIAAGAGGPAT